MKPIIGISCGIMINTKSTTLSHQPQEMHQLGDAYVRAIERAGGIPMLLPVYSDPELAKYAINKVDGVILSGGGDVDPAIFGDRANTHLRPVIPRRDNADMAIADYVLNYTDKPLLGICRGTQVINVAMGGTLFVDLKDSGKLDHSLTMYPRNMFSHKIDVKEGTHLASILGAGITGVNSYHHQAVDRLAEGLVASAYSTIDGIIEAFEMPGERFVMGVQWHPEGLYDTEPQQGIFRELIKAASR